MLYGSYNESPSRKGALERSHDHAADRRLAGHVDDRLPHVEWRQEPGVVTLDDERCLSGSDSLYRYSGRYTVRDRTLLCDGVEMTPANGCRLTPWARKLRRVRWCSGDDGQARR